MRWTAPGSTDGFRPLGPNQTWDERGPLGRATISDEAMYIMANKLDHLMYEQALSRRGCEALRACRAEVIYHMRKKWPKDFWASDMSCLSCRVDASCKALLGDEVEQDCKLHGSENDFSFWRGVFRRCEMPLQEKTWPSHGGGFKIQSSWLS